MSGVKLAIVGGNSHIGSELCFLLRDSGVEPLPVVRNPMGGAFLSHHGFKVRIADVTDEHQARRVLSDVNFVLIAAYDTHFGSESREKNSNLVKNSVLYSSPGSGIALMSSLRVFSRKVDSSTSIWFSPPHDKEKRNMETVLFEECKKHGKLPFALRLGHVYGQNQSKTQRMLGALAAKSTVLARVQPEAISNVVHTVTLNEAVLKCIDSKVDPGAYSIVNFPQWTWKQVLEYYAEPGTTFIFKPGKVVPIRRKKANWIGAPVVRYVRQHRGLLFSIRLHLPNHLVAAYELEGVRDQFRSAISELEEKSVVSFAEFEYNPVPGPYIQDLSETRRLLDKLSPHEGVFATSKGAINFCE